MDEIRRRDLQVFWSEVFSFQRIAFSVVATGLLVALIAARTHSALGDLLIILAIPLLVAVHGWFAWQASEPRRFHDAHLKALWAGCVDRHQRFKEVLQRNRGTSVSDLVEMPKTIAAVSQSVYRALRKADLVQHEIGASEAGLPPLPPPNKPISADPQSRELFQVADRNIAEYRQGLEAVMAGVQRSEAQAAVFMTTLDTLRMKVLGYRLVGKGPELPSHEFLAAIAEAKLQLESIDKALDELDMGLYPQSIAAVRPPLAPNVVASNLTASSQTDEPPSQHVEGHG